MNTSFKAVAAGMLLAGIALMASTEAQASSITYNSIAPISLTDTNWNTAEGDTNPLPLLIPKFNFAGKILDSAKLDFFGNAAFDFSITNNSTRSTTTLFSDSTLAASLSFNGTSISLLLKPTTSIVANNTFLARGATLNSSLITSDQKLNLDVVLDLGGTLAPFIGAGNVSFDVNAEDNNFVHTSGGRPSFSSFAAAGADIKVTYNYHSVPLTSVPEPATLGLMCLGLAGLTVSRKKQHG